MNRDVFTYFLVVWVMMSWPVWLLGGFTCFLVWRLSKNWHPLAQLLTRSFLVALTVTPTFFGGHPPGMGPAIYIFRYESPDHWLAGGIFPIFVGWLVVFSNPIFIVLVRSIYDWVSQRVLR